MRLLILLALMLPGHALAQTPQACTAFTPEVSCNAATGLPIVTLHNTLAGSFDPNLIHITTATPGVTLMPNPSDPLALQLIGASAGQSITLSLDATAEGAGSAEGLDKCCMGDLSVTIPPGFTCERPTVFSLSHLCALEPIRATELGGLCTIALHYEGPAPEVSPLLLSEHFEGMGWTLDGPVLSGEGWDCAALVGDTLNCKLPASAEPAADWQDFTSTLAVKLTTPRPFKSCASLITPAGKTEACWSSETPRLQLTKTAPATCAPGGTCSFEVTLTNPGTEAYNGPLSLQEAFRQTTPPTAGLGGFTAITPPLCPLADLNAGLCAGEVSLPAGAAQSYQIDWTPPDFGAPYSAVNCASAASLAGDALGDAEPFGGIAGLACATVQVTGEPPATAPEKTPETGLPQLTLSKTAPEPCKVNVSSQIYRCGFELTLTNQAASPFSGSVAVQDRFGKPFPSGVNTEGWTCDPTAEGLSCLVPDLFLAPQQATTFAMDLTLPGLAKGGSFENCARFAAPEAARDKSRLLQRLLLARGENIGKADGQIGAKTRAALVTLQAELGLEPTGAIDDQLMARILPDLPATEACVTVDLPPMPAPPLVCDKATTVKDGGTCACRYRGMQRAGKQACACAKGTTLVAGKGCVASRTPPKKQTKPSPTQPQQPPRDPIPLRFCPNGLPEIPGVGCIQFNPKPRGTTGSSILCSDPTGIKCR
ncbi:MAG: peptidoglycan-binding domain-containing protein [Cypionkella sp.]